MSTLLIRVKEYIANDYKWVGRFYVGSYESASMFPTQEEVRSSEPTRVFDCEEYFIELKEVNEE